MQSKRWLVALLAFGLVLSACGGDDDDTTGGDTTAGDTDGTTGDTGDTGDTDGQAGVDPSGVLTYGVSLSGSGISNNYAPAESTSICDFAVMKPVYDTLVHRNPLTGQAEPGLAESWEVVDPSTLELTLRSGLTFHDGQAFNAQAVADGLNYNLEGDAQVPTTLQPLIESVEAVDDTTVRITTAEPIAAGLPIILSGREGMIIAPGSAETANDNPVGAGPFVFESQTPQQQVSLRRFEDYYAADDVQLGGVDLIHTEAGPPVVNALLAGDFDMAQITPDSIAGLEGGSNIEINEQASQTYYKVNYNLGVEPFNNKAFRQAINYALDKQAVLDAVFLGRGEIAWGIYPSNFAGYASDVEGMYAQDLDRARQLLAESGFEGASFTFVVPPAPTFERFAEILQANLAEIGITLELQNSTDILTDYFQNQTVPGAVLIWPPRPDPVETIDRQFTPGSFNNIGGYDNEQLNQIVTDARSTADPDERAALLQDGMQLIAEEALDLPAVFQPLLHATNTDRIGGEVQQHENCQGVDFSKLHVKAG